MSRVSEIYSNDNPRGYFVTTVIDRTIAFGAQTKETDSEQGRDVVRHSMLRCKSLGIITRQCHV